MKLYEEFTGERDKFEIVAFHDATAKTFGELDQKVAPAKAKFWGGKDLPFPVLLDATGETIRSYGITSFPTILLIDPEGKLVRGGSEQMLAQHLRSGGEGRKGE